MSDCCIDPVCCPLKKFSLSLMQTQRHDRQGFCVNQSCTWFEAAIAFAWWRRAELQVGRAPIHSAHRLLHVHAGPAHLLGGGPEPRRGPGAGIRDPHPGAGDGGPPLPPPNADAVAPPDPLSGGASPAAHPENAVPAAVPSPPHALPPALAGQLPHVPADCEDDALECDVGCDLP